MTKLIVNADDFGLSEAVNYGIVSAYKNGIVRSTTIMAGMGAFDHAVELLKDNEGLGCGVHMTLSLGKPVIDGHKTIVDKNGIFYRRVSNELIEEKFDLDEVYTEFCAQIDKVIKAGVKVTHLDSHHHVHTLKNLKPVIEKIVEKYNLPIRGGFENDIKYGKIIPMIDTFYNERVTLEYFETNIENFKKYDYVDLMSHPAYIDEVLVKSTSYSLKRMEEYSILTSETVKELLKENNIGISGYPEI